MGVTAVLLTCLYCSFIHQAYLSIIVTNYSRESRCTGMTLSRGHRLHTHRVKTKLECLVACSGDDACVSVVIEKASGLLCHLGSSLAASDLLQHEAVNGSVTYYRKKQYQGSHTVPEICQNGGVYFADNNTCQCVAPYHGTNCTNAYRDCADISDAGQTQGGPYLIHPPASPAPFPVFCKANQGRTYLLVRQHGDVDFNRPWQDYVHGFGQVSGDHWLGLEHVRHLTMNEGKNYSFRFSFTLSNGTKIYINYNDFKLGGAEIGYTFTMVPHVRDKSPDDCLSPLVGAPFSTYDNDSDNSTSINCAQRHGGGWWYSGDTCSSVCSPLGRLTNAGGVWSGDERDAFWTVNSVRMAPAALKGFLIVL